MDMEPVESSLISHLGYDQPSRTLAVQFALTGDVYHYTGVPPVMYAGLRQSTSLGAHFGPESILPFWSLLAWLLGSSSVVAGEAESMEHK